MSFLPRAPDPVPRAPRRAVPQVRMRTASSITSSRPLGMILTKNDMVDLRAVRDRWGACRAGWRGAGC